MAATFIALVAVSAFVLPTIDNADLSVDMDVDYGGETLTYMVSLMNASANAKYYVVVMEGSTVVYEKEITGGYQTDTVQGLDSTKEHRVEVRTGLVPLYVAAAETIPAVSVWAQWDHVDAVKNTIDYGVDIRLSGEEMRVSLYDSATSAVVYTKDLAQGLNADIISGLEYSHSYTLTVTSSGNIPLSRDVVTEDKAVQEATAAPVDIAYGESKSVIITGLEENPAITYTVQAGTSVTVDESTGELTWVELGESTVRISFAETDNYAAGYVDVTVTASKARPTVTAPTAITGLVYTGFAQNMINTGSSDDGIVKYSLSLDPGSFTTDIPQGTDAGTYNVYYMVEGDATHSDLGPSEDYKVTVTIDKADSAVTQAPAAVDGLVYNESSLELVTAGTATGGEMQYSLTSGGDYSATLPTGINAGTYNVYYKVVGDSNHNDTAEAGPVAVSVAKATVAWPTIDSKVYNENVQTADVPLDARYTVTANAGGTDAGSYAVTLTLTDDAFVNYKWTDVDTQAKEVANAFVISKADAAITRVPRLPTPEEWELVYDNGSLVYLVYPGEATGGVMQYRVDSGSYSADYPAMTNAGTYNVYYKVVGDDNHNDVAEAGPIEVTIAKAASSIGSVVGVEVYDSGSAQSLVETSMISGGTLRYYITTTQVASQEALEAVAEGDWSASAEQTDCNTYYVYYKLVGDSNHTDIGPLLANMVTSKILEAITYQIDVINPTVYPHVYIHRDYGGATIECKLTIYDADTSTAIVTDYDMYHVPDSNPSHYRYDEDGDWGYSASPGNYRFVITVYVDGVAQSPYEETVHISE